MNANYVQRLRVTFRKSGPARWIGHLDVNRTWERALNRAGIPMAYTQGFNRRPRMQFASALPLGYTSECELVDLWLGETMAPEQALSQLQERMAPGIEVVAVEEVSVREAALPTLPTTAHFTARLNHVEVEPAELKARIEAFNAADEVLAEKRSRKSRGKKFNLRPRVFELALVEEQPLVIEMVVSAEERTNGRPGDVLLALDIDPRATHIHRSKLVLREDE